MVNFEGFLQGGAFFPSISEMKELFVCGDSDTQGWEEAAVVCQSPVKSLHSGLARIQDTAAGKCHLLPSTSHAQVLLLLPLSSSSLVTSKYKLVQENNFHDDPNTKSE